jgi:ketosteroid isomerase-like protein
MSREDVEVVRAAYEAWNRGDLPALRKAFHSDAEIRPLLGAVPSASIYHGHEGITRWLADAYEPWDELRVELSELIERPGCVVGLARLVGRGKGSGVEVASDVAHVAVVRDGQIVRFDGFHNREEALEAVGLRE